LTSWLHGKVEDAGNGALRVTYEFDKDAEAQDLAFDAKYEAEWSKYLSSTEQSAAPSEFVVAGGAFCGGGSVVYRLPVAFEAPLKVIAHMQFAGSDAPKRFAYTRIGAADDGNGSYVGCDSLGSLVVIDQASAMRQSALRNEAMTLDPGHVYVLALAIDGKRATTFVDDQKVKELPCGPRKRGGVFFAASASASIALQRLVVEGRPALEENRAAWVAARLAELGLTPAAAPAAK
jgi:hypothetical protein